MNFGHHPDPAVDFALEVDAVENDLIDRAAGMKPQIEDIGARIERAMQFRVGGSAACVAAKADLRKYATGWRAAAATGTQPGTQQEGA